ncbi:hypothetical protein [Paenibacillus sp. ACRRX]|nr:hypothetical protein [Paenibacillus sp. ACRRX]
MAIKFKADIAHFIERCRLLVKKCNEQSVVIAAAQVLKKEGH